MLFAACGAALSTFAEQHALTQCKIRVALPPTVPFGDQKGTRYGLTPNAAAAPATVSGEPNTIQPLGQTKRLTWEGGGRHGPASQETCRHIVVMHEHIGRGAPIETGHGAHMRAALGLGSW